MHVLNRALPANLVEKVLSEAAASRFYLASYLA